jgi:6-phosphogluconolactonase (cycloisomerase 2 family)
VGSTAIGASFQGVSGSTNLAVSASVLLSIEVLPANSTLAAGSDRQFQANGTYDDNSTVDITDQVAWGSSAPNLATVSPSGLVAAVAAGPTTISAGLDGVVGSTALTVSNPALVSISITPGNGGSIATGTAVSYRATGNFANGTTADITESVTWSTTNTQVATVSNATGQRGQVTGLQNGLTQISATEGGVQASVNARVMLYLYGTDGMAVFGYSIDPTSGALTPVPDPVTFDGCICQLIVDPTNRLVYALDGDNGLIFTLDIESDSGRLLLRPGSVPTGPAPDRMALSPNGGTLYVTDVNYELFGYTIDSNGTLTPTASTTPIGQATVALAFDATGDFLYAADLADNELYGFAVNSSSGALTALAGSPYPTGDGPFGLATSTNGNFVYVLNSRDGDISGYQAGPDGALSPLSGFPVALGGAPYNLIGDPLGRFFYAIDFSDASVYALDADPATGGLTTVAGQPFQGTGILSYGIAIDPSGRFVYTSYLADPEVNGFSVDPSSGALAPLPSDPFPVDEPFSAITTTH